MTSQHATPDRAAADDLLEGIDFGDTGADEASLTGSESDSERADSGPGRRAAGKARQPNIRPLIRRAAAKTVEIASAPPAQRRLLAAVLGCPDEVAMLATEVMCAQRGVTSVVSDLEEVAGSDPMEAGVIVASWERSRSNALWSLLAELGAVKGTRPPQDAKAAIAMARSALGLSDADKKSLAGVVTLARKS